MSLTNSILNLLNKHPKDPNNITPVGSRSERESKIKDKAGLVINIFALLLAINSWYGGKLSSTIMNNTLSANDTYAFYQAKSLKQALAENALYDAEKLKDINRIAELTARIDRLENDPKDGKTALLTKARKLEFDRDQAKLQSPWIGYASTAYQLSIVVLSASILAVSMPLFWSSFLVAGFGLLLSIQCLLLWL